MRYRVLAAAVVLALALVTGTAAAQRHQLIAKAKSTRAVLRYVDMPRAWKEHPRMRIERGGRRLFHEIVPSHPRDRGSPGIAVPLGDRPLIVRDLDSDGEPEVVLDLYWHGAHCCAWTRVYRLDPTRRTYSPLNQWWGELKAMHSLRDIDHDGMPEFVARDDRFMKLSYFSADPIRIWSYREGRFIDVTRRYPALVARDAEDWWRAYLRHRGKDRWARAPLAAWAADHYLLGHRRLVDQTLARALQTGALKPTLEPPRDPHAYVRELKVFLRRTGYLR